MKNNDHYDIILPEDSFKVQQMCYDVIYEVPPLFRS